MVLRLLVLTSFLVYSFCSEVPRQMLGPARACNLRNTSALRARYCIVQKLKVLFCQAAAHGPDALALDIFPGTLLFAQRFRDKC